MKSSIFFLLIYHKYQRTNIFLKPGLTKKIVLNLIRGVPGHSKHRGGEGCNSGIVEIFTIIEGKFQKHGSVS
jgi:hypothetical protein